MVEFLDRLIAAADPDIVRPLARRIEKRYEKILLKTKVSKLEALPEGLRATFESADGSRPRPRPRSTIACCWPWGAARTARTSPPTRPA